MQVPFIKNQMQRRDSYHSTKLKDITDPFEATLKFERYETGGYGRYPYVRVKDVTRGITYVMSVCYFMDEVPNINTDGQIRGTWKFVKKSGNVYTIKRHNTSSNSRKTRQWTVPFGPNGMVRQETFNTSTYIQSPFKSIDRIIPNTVNLLSADTPLELTLEVIKINTSENTLGHVVFRNKEFIAHKYYMFMSDFERIVNKLQRGVIKGKFRFVKRGDSFGIELINEYSLNTNTFDSVYSIPPSFPI